MGRESLAEATSPQHIEFRSIQQDEKTAGGGQRALRPELQLSRPVDSHPRYLSINQTPNTLVTEINVSTSDIGDHRIEVIGLENCLHMGQVRTGLKASARRLGN